jgi:hypothetical protein
MGKMAKRWHYSTFSESLLMSHLKAICSEDRRTDGLMDRRVLHMSCSFLLKIIRKHSEFVTALKQAMGLIPGPSARRTNDLLKLNRDQLRWMVRLFTGHLFKLALTDDPTCERCLEKDDSATHIICDFATWVSFYGIKWLLWRPHKESPTFHVKWRINKMLAKKGEAQ